ncbi:MAG: ribosomal-processing cysteine protease Prp [Firmicutes bacterium]|nr:ribosomal-processing cysteine protease Prp [Bacillota bacterium]
MIRVQIWKTREGAYRSFQCLGHADYSESGADVVCAGVSAIVISTVNSLQDLLHEKIDCQYDEKDGGDLTVNILEDLSPKGQFLVDHMIYGLEWIQRQYGKRYLRYEIKEV